MPASTVAVLSDTTSGGTRQLRLRFSAPTGVLNSQVFVTTTGPLTALAADGTALDVSGPTPQTMQVNLIGRHAGGVTLDVSGAAGPISVTVQDRHLGLPAIPDFTVAPRPAWMAPMPLNDVADSTIVRRTYSY